MKYFFIPGFLKIFFTLILFPFIYIGLTFSLNPILEACYPPTLNETLIQFCNGIAWFLDQTVMWFFPVLALLISYVICSAIGYLLFRASGNIPQKKTTKQKTLTAVPLIALIVISFFSFPFIALTFIVPLFVISSSSGQITNESKQLVREVLPYAESQGWQKIAELNGTKGIDNQIPWYNITFQTRQKPNEVKEGIYSVLTQKGYTMQTKLYTPGSGYYGGNVTDDGFYIPTTNDNQPYWMLKGESQTGNAVTVTITDRIYDDNTKEFPVPPGMTAISLKFSYKEALKTTTPNPTPATFQMLAPNPQEAFKK